MRDIADLDTPVSYDERIAYIKRHNLDMSDDQAKSYLSALIHRREKKQEFLARGYSNRLAEKTLDRMLIPRPWGWRTVFFYPDSNTPRTRYVLIALAAIYFAYWWSVRNG